MLSWWISYPREVYRPSALEFSASMPRYIVSMCFFFVVRTPLAHPAQRKNTGKQVLGQTYGLEENTPGSPARSHNSGVQKRQFFIYFSKFQAVIDALLVDLISQRGVQAECLGIFSIHAQIDGIHALLPYPLHGR